MTKIINMFGAPSSGKSTCASQLFSLMKNHGVNAELVTEFAKELTWHQSKALDCQPYVFGHQLVRLEVLLGKVDYIITDSPILLSCIYNEIPELSALALRKHHDMSNINILLNRTKSYNPIGRNQTEAESDEIQQKIKEFLSTQRIDYVQCDGNAQGIQRYFDLWIKPKLENFE